MYRVGLGGGAVLGGADDGQRVVAGLQIGGAAGNGAGLAVRRHAAQVDMLRLIGNVEHVFSHLGIKHGTQLPGTDGQRGQPGIAAGNVVGILLSGGADRIGLGVSVLCCDGQRHGVGAHAEAVAGYGHLGAAVLGGVAQRQRRHAVGNGDGIAGGVGGESRRQGAAAAAEAAQPGVGA